MLTNIDMSNNSPINHLICIYSKVFILTVHVHNYVEMCELGFRSFSRHCPYICIFMYYM